MKNLKAKHIEWIESFIKLWEATANLETGAYNDPINYAADSLIRTYQNFCERYDLPSLSADELLMFIKNSD